MHIIKYSYFSQKLSILTENGPRPTTASTERGDDWLVAAASFACAAALTPQGATVANEPGAPPCSHGTSLVKPIVSG